MKILKKLNLLDWVIIGGILFLGFGAVYSLINRGEENKYTLGILLEDGCEAYEGDLCTDSENGENLGKVLKITGNEAEIEVDGKKAEHGIKVNGKIYLRNMPILLYIGDCYGEGRVGFIKGDN